MHFLRKSRTKTTLPKNCLMHIFSYFSSKPNFYKFFISVVGRRSVGEHPFAWRLEQGSWRTQVHKEETRQRHRGKFPSKHFGKKAFLKLLFFVCFLILGKVLVHLIVLKSISPKKIWGKLRQCWKILKLFEAGYDISMNLIPN